MNSETFISKKDRLYKVATTSKDREALASELFENQTEAVWNGLIDREERQQSLNDYFQSVSADLDHLLIQTFTKRKTLLPYCLSSLQMSEKEAVARFQNDFANDLPQKVSNDVIEKIKLTHSWATKKQKIWKVG